MKEKIMFKKILNLLPVLVVSFMLTTECEAFRDGSHGREDSQRIAENGAVGIGLGYTIGNEAGSIMDTEQGYDTYPYGSNQYYKDPFYHRY